jgi:hypothetical protein
MAQVGGPVQFVRVCSSVNQILHTSSTKMSVWRGTANAVPKLAFLAFYELQGAIDGLN